jgi:hypothetical protein
MSCLCLSRVALHAARHHPSHPIWAFLRGVELGRKRGQKLFYPPWDELSTTIMTGGRILRACDVRLAGARSCVLTEWHSLLTSLAVHLAVTTLNARSAAMAHTNSSKTNSPVINRTPPHNAACAAGADTGCHCSNRLLTSQPPSAGRTDRWSDRTAALTHTKTHTNPASHRRKMGHLVGSVDLPMPTVTSMATTTNTTTTGPHRVATLVVNEDRNARCDANRSGLAYVRMLAARPATVPTNANAAINTQIALSIFHLSLRQGRPYVHPTQAPTAPALTNDAANFVNDPSPEIRLPARRIPVLFI